MQLCECGCGNAAPIAKKTNRSRGWVAGQPVRYIRGHNARDFSWLAYLPGESNPAWRGDKAGYHAIHYRVRNERGLASEHACVDCGAAAAHWSFTGKTGYSTNVTAYDPRCNKCHITFDRKKGLCGCKEE